MAAVSTNLGSPGQGPRLMLSKTHLFMESYVGTQQTDELEVSNCGTAAVFYEWKRFSRPDFIPAKRSDGSTRFYCHYGKGMLLPGSSKKFVFSFTSTKTGFFTEEWDLLTDPLLEISIPQLVLTGRAFEDDSYVSKRFYLEEELTRRTTLHTAQEALDDIIRSVRTPTPPPPDLEDPRQFQEQFESKNIGEGVYFTPEVMEMLQDVRNKALEFVNQPPEEWNLTIEQIRQTLAQVHQVNEREKLEERLKAILLLARQKPPERSTYWEFASSVVLKTLESIIDTSDSIRQELDMEEYYFYLPWDISDERLELLQKEKAEKEAAKGKAARAKKPKTEEELQKEKEAYIQRLSGTVTSSVVENTSEVQTEKYFIELWEHIEMMHQCNEIPKILQNTNRLNKHMKNSNIANLKLYNSKLFRLNHQNLGRLSRKIGIPEIDMEGKKVMIRVDLDVQLSDPVWEEVEDEEGNIEKRCQPRDILNPEKLKPVLELIQYCIDHLVKCVMIVGSLGPATGEHREENSLLPLADYIEQSCNQEVQFLEDLEIDNFEEKVEEYPENSIIVFENTCFHPAEFGFSKNKDEEIVHINYESVLKFRAKFAAYSDIYINDCATDQKVMEASVRPVCSITNPGCSTVECAQYSNMVLMGPHIENDVKGIATLLFEPDRPILVLLGHNEGSSVSILDKIAMAYSLIDVVDIIFIAGELALIFLAAQGQLEYDFDPRLRPFMERVQQYAVDKGVKIILPEDFLIAEKVPIPEINEGQYTWAHFADSFTAVSAGEEIPKDFYVVGFGDATKQKLADTLGNTRRIYWCGSLDLHFSMRDELKMLNYLAYSFVKMNKEAKELTVVVHDVENLLYAHIANEEATIEENKEEGEEDLAPVESASLGSGEINTQPQVLTPQEQLDLLVNAKLIGGVLPVTILQGRLIRTLLMLAEYPPPKQKSLEEDTSFLDSI